MITFQEMIRKLIHYWEAQGCVIHQGYDLEVGAGTSNPATFLRSLGPEPYYAAYVEPSRRPTDGRYGTNPNRLQHYFQFQVILKPSPPNILELYEKSLETIGINLKEHDLRYVHDDWENPSLGAWGLGWEVWLDGMEVTQFTYFQSVGGVTLKPITGEITLGLERLAMYLQGVNNVYDLKWNDKLTYGDIYHRNEVEWSGYNFEHATTEMWLKHFEDYEREAKKMMEKELPIPAYDFVMKASHAFNMLDARGVISVSERTGYIGRIRDLARAIADSYIKSREKAGFPLLKKLSVQEETKIAPQSLSKKLEMNDPNEKEDFLLEIGSEELPASFISIGVQNLKNAMQQLLDKEGITYEEIQTYGTPRRLAIVVKNLALGKAAQNSERKGPAVAQAFDDSGNLKPAGEGFFKSIGKKPLNLNDIRAGKDSEITLQNVKGTEYIFARVLQSGRATAPWLIEQLPQLILNLDFPKKMRWGNLDITYARPLRWIVALFGDEIVPFGVGTFVSGRKSWGHSQLDANWFDIDNSKNYVETLRKHYVMVDIEERKKSIATQLDKLEQENSAKALVREELIPKVVQLVEWPELMVGSFDAHFLKAPKEVLISEMVEHQFDFPLAKEDGTLINKFVITADTKPSEKIRKGNQNVLSARLSDGVFLYEKGLRHPLQEFNEKLKNVTYLKNFGTIFDKVERLIKHAQVIQDILKISNPKKSVRAAALCKADLASEMVFEFPELQGTIGKYYALAHGEDREVSQSIEEHWMPRGDRDDLPSTETGTLLSISDKLDNLICCFSANLIPTSSADPYALRRQVLGIIRMLIQGQFKLPLRSTLRNFCDHFTKLNEPQKTIENIENFFINRIKTVFLDYGFKKDEIEASLSYGFTDIYDTFCRVQALHEFRQIGDKFPQLFEVYKRARGQLEGQNHRPFSENLLKENAEKELDRMLVMTKPKLEHAINSQNYREAYQLIAHLQPSLNDLFNEVHILTDDSDLKNNRIALLQRVFTLFGQLLDFSKIQENAKIS